MHGHHQNEQFGVTGLQASDEVNAALVAERDVHNYKVRACFARQSNGIVDPRRLTANGYTCCAIDQLPQTVAKERMIIHNEDARRSLLPDGSGHGLRIEEDGCDTSARRKVRAGVFCRSAWQ